MPKSTKSNKVDWEPAPDIKNRLNSLVTSLDMDWINPSEIHAFRSKKSKARAYARIWGLTRIWQKALKKSPAYIIEVLSEKFDSLPESKKDEILIHELAHIPKNFSGSLLPHYKKGSRNFNDKVKRLIVQYKKLK